MEKKYVCLFSKNLFRVKMTENKEDDRKILKFYFKTGKKATKAVQDEDVVSETTVRECFSQFRSEILMSKMRSALSDQSVKKLNHAKRGVRQTHNQQPH